jgi:hypothetical protein
MRSKHINQKRNSHLKVRKENEENELDQQEKGF